MLIQQVCMSSQTCFCLFGLRLYVSRHVGTFSWVEPVLSNEDVCTWVSESSLVPVLGTHSHSILGISPSC